MTETRHTKKRFGFFSVFFIPIALLLSSAVALILYQNETARNAQAQTYQVLADSASEQIDTLNAVLDGKFSVLKSFAAALGAEEAPDAENVRIRMEGILQSTGFQELYLSDTSGKAFSNSGKTLNLAGTSYLTLALQGKHGLDAFPSSQNNDTLDFVLYAPVIRDGSVTNVVCAIYGETDLAKMITSRIYGQTGRSFVCDNKGTIIISEEREDRFAHESNIFTILKESSFSKGSSAQAVKNNLILNKSGVFSFSTGTTAQYGVYTPIAETKWFLFNLVDAAQIDAQIDHSVASGSVFMIGLGVISLILLVFIYFWNRYQSKRLERESEKLRVSEERFHIALRDTTLSIWDYDFATHSIIQTDRSVEMHGFEKVVPNVPDYLIECGFVLPESADAFRAMYQKLFDGAAGAEGVFRVLSPDRVNSWYEHIRYINVFDANGKPFRAVGVSEDVTDRVLSEQRYQQEIQLHNTLAQDVHATLILNLTKREVGEVGYQGLLAGQTFITDFSKVFESIASHVASGERVRRKLLSLSAEKLIAKFEAGEKNLSYEYQYLLPDGSANWYSFEIHLLRSPQQEDVMAFLYLRDINQSRQEREELEHRAQTDSLTGLLNRGAVKPSIDTYLEEKSPDALCAFYMIDLDNFKNVNDKISHVEGDRVLARVGEELGRLTSSNELTARLGGDEFLVFLKNASSMEMVFAKAAELCASLQFTVSSEDVQIEVSCSVGIAVSKNDHKDFESLYKEADIALYNAKDEGKKRYCILSDNLPEDAKHPSSVAAHPIPFTEEITTNTTVQLSALLRYMDGGVLLMEVGEKLRSLYVSPSFFSATGRKPKDTKIEGDSLLQYVFSDDRELLANALRSAAQNHSIVDLAFRVIRPDQNTGWRHMRAVEIPYEASDKPVFIGIITDITELRESSAQLNAIFDNAPSGIARLMIGEKWKVDFCNRTFRAFLEPFASETAELCLTDTKELIHPADFPAIKERTEESIQKNLSISISFRLNPHLVGGKEKWIMVNSVPIGEKNGFPLLLAMYNDVTEQKLLEQRLSDERKTLQLAFDQSSLLLWTYDRTTKTVTIPKEGAVYKNMPDNHIQKGYIAVESVDTVLEFYRRMESTDTEGFAVVKSKTDTEDYRWHRLSFRNEFDENGIWKKTICLTVDLPRIDIEKAHFDQEEQLRIQLSGNRLATLKINLTQDKVESAVFSKRSILFGQVFESCDSLINTLSSHITDSEENYAFLSRMSPTALVDAFSAGTTWISSEYPRRTPNGQIRWTACSAKLLNDPVTNNLYAFCYIRDIDTRKRWELSLNHKTSRSKLTMLYDLETVRNLTQTILHKHDYAKNTLVGFVTVELRGIDEIRNDLGPGAADATLFTVGRIARILLDAECIPGSDDEQNIYIFCPAVQSAEFMEKRTQEFLSFLQELRQKGALNEQLTLAVGCSVGEAEKASFEQLRQVSENAVAEIGEFPNAQFFAWKSLSLSAEDEAPEDLLAFHPDLEADLDEASRQALDECLKILLLAQDIHKVASQILPIVGKLYNASRVFTLLLDNEQKNISLASEWTDGKAHSMKEKLSNVPIARFPIARQALLANDAVSLSGAENSSWSYLCIPFRHHANTYAILCVDTPFAYKNDASFLKALIAYWVQAASTRHQGGVISDKITYFDPLTGLFNRNRFSERLLEFVETEYSSLGVLYADLNGLSIMNHDLGQQFGDGMICHAAKVLEQLFGRENVYRISGDEFVVLAPNVVYDFFAMRCQKAEKLYDAEYQSGIAIGYTWEDKNIKIQSMIEHAEALMKMAKQTHYDARIENGQLERPELFAQLQEDIAAGRYEVFLQPKLSIASGKVAGAEALVRYRDADGRITSPVKFISRLESQNLIRHLDFFVLEKVLSNMKRMRDRGEKPFPCAINFSRKTLLDRETTPRVKKLLEQYRIPVELLEIEITESIGSVERTTVAAACRSLSEIGVSLALDDFGSDYSSLSILSAIHFDVLKIDKSLVDNILSNHAARTIVQTTITLAQSLSIKVVAEGVEKEEQLRLLKEMGCDLAQGYLIDKPLPGSEFAKKYEQQEKED